MFVDEACAVRRGHGKTWVGWAEREKINYWKGESMVLITEWFHFGRRKRFSSTKQFCKHLSRNWVESWQESGWCSGYHARFTRERSRVRTSHPIFFLEWSWRLNMERKEIDGEQHAQDLLQISNLFVFYTCKHKKLAR